MLKKISFLILVFVLIILFRKYFSPGTLVFGDAPYFYKEGLKELFSFPLAWTTRGNTFGNINLFIWISPLMFLYGLMGTLLHFNNDLILRVLFYFPSLIFGFTGVYLFTRQEGFSKLVSFFAVTVYLINTYYLLLVDGGQIGVVLAYGLFPLVLYLLAKNKFLVSLLSLFFLTVVDFRVSAICIVLFLILKVRNLEQLKRFLLILFSLIGLSLYWIIPTVKLATTFIDTSLSSLGTTSLINSLFLSSPNWPTNQFGSVVPTFFYFSFVPILILLPIFINKKRKTVFLVLVFLVFAFLAKGESNPFGVFYKYLVSIKFGSVFRDSTKFFILLNLIGGILIGVSVEEISKKVKYFQVAAFIFIIFIVWQGFFGKMNGVLGKNIDISDYQNIYNNISNRQGFLRTAWFTEKSPFAYNSNEKQAIDARDLVNFRPFASMNVGTGDRFNFINNKSYLDWFDLTGINYLILNGNPRVSALSKSDQEDWERLNKLLNSDKRLVKKEIATSFPIYQTPQIHPNKFFVNQAFVVVGGDDVYEKLTNINSNFSVGNQGILFAEDGKLDLNNLQEIASTSAILVFDNKTENDLSMAFLQKDFISPLDSKNPQWAIRSSNDYLNSKFELLTHGIDTKEYDYGKGIAFSTQKNETMQFKVYLDTEGEYDLIVRAITNNLKVIVDGDYSKAQVYSGKDKNNFEWFERDNLNLKAGDHYVVFENAGENQVVNTFAFIPASEMQKAKQLTQNFLGTFKSFDLKNKNDNEKLKQVIDTDKWEGFDSENITKNGWIIYTDTYDSNWEFGTKASLSNSEPMYSMLNGFYVSPKLTSGKFIFKGDEYFRWGIYFSIISLLIIAIVWSYKYLR